MSTEPILGPDPFSVFFAWYEEAVQSGLGLPDAMALATADASGQPSVRVVLFKGVSGGGFRFFTNYDSRKAQDIQQNPKGALVFYWSTLHRQVRAEGAIERLDPEESDEYFRTRPRESQLGAWASPQSRPVDAATLEQRVAEVTQRFAGKTVDRPPFWGGYRLIPTHFEFWIGKEHRLHDRWAYDRQGGDWVKTRLGA